MAHVNLSELKAAAIGAAKTSRVGSHVDDIDLEAGRDDDGWDFLRVIVRFNGLDDVEDESLEELRDLIESAVSGIDERFPSIRFADAD